MTLDKINPTKTKSWKILKSLKSTVDLKTLFKNDNERLKNIQSQLMNYMLIIQKT